MTQVLEGLLRFMNAQDTICRFKVWFTPEDEACVCKIWMENLLTKDQYAGSYASFEAITEPDFSLPTDTTIEMLTNVLNRAGNDATTPFDIVEEDDKLQLTFYVQFNVDSIRLIPKYTFVLEKTYNAGEELHALRTRVDQLTKELESVRTTTPFIKTFTLVEEVYPEDYAMWESMEADCTTEPVGETTPVLEVEDSYIRFGAPGWYQISIQMKHASKTFGPVFEVWKNAATVQYCFDGGFEDSQIREPQLMANFTTLIKVEAWDEVEIKNASNSELTDGTLTIYCFELL